ncbi:MAG TPA: hypothetical protein VEZ20_01695 [Allosphingosinicella sp.]|nr:hypothetical protein [Allosphingosinicella sp.]
MGSTDDSADPRPRVDAAAKAAFLTALRAGAHRDAAAQEAGFTANAFYDAKKKDPIFALAWAWALDLSAADERRPAPGDPVPGDDREEIIAPNANRRLQRRKVRRPLFNAERKRIYLDHFAGTADHRASAAAAGVQPCTVTNHNLHDSEFAAARREALAVAYAALEAEAVRQRLEAQAKLREGLCPTGEVAMEFDRVMKLLAGWERRGGGIGFRTVAPGRQKRCTFDEAIDELDRKLRALGVRKGLAPPDDPPPPPPPAQPPQPDPLP